MDEYLSDVSMIIITGAEVDFRLDAITKTGIATVLGIFKGPLLHSVRPVAYFDAF